MDANEPSMMASSFAGSRAAAGNAANEAQPPSKPAACAAENVVRFIPVFVHSPIH
jgi:hypothetical protein